MEGGTDEVSAFNLRRRKGFASATPEQTIDAYNSFTQEVKDKGIDEAVGAYERALEQTANRVEREFLERRLAEVQGAE